MPLFGPFVDKKGPVISAAFCNALDLIQNAMSGDANGALTIQQPTVAEPALTVNSFPGLPSIVATGTGGIVVGSAGGGVVFQQQSTGLGAFVNQGNQGFQFFGGNVGINGGPGNVAALQLIGNGDTIANAFTLQYGPLGTAQFLFKNAERANISATGNWTFDAETSGGLNPTVLVDGSIGQFGLKVLGYTGLPVGKSYGLYVQAGTAPGDVSLYVTKVDQSQAYFAVKGDGTLLGNGPINQVQRNAPPFGAPLIDMTPDYGSFTGTLTGFTGTVAGTFWFLKMGCHVLIYYPGSNLTGTSNSSTMGLSGVPSSLWSTAAVQNISAREIIDAGVAGMGGVIVGAGGVYNFANYVVSGSKLISSVFTASGVKGITGGLSFIYSTI